MWSDTVVPFLLIEWKKLDYIIQALDRHCRVEGGYAGISDVYQVGSKHNDVQAIIIYRSRSSPSFYFLRKLAILAGQSTKGRGGVLTLEPKKCKFIFDFKKLDVLKWKTTKIVFIINEVIHPYGCVILVPFKKWVFQFPVSALYEFFRIQFDYF